MMRTIRYPILIGAFLAVALSGVVALAHTSTGMMGGTSRGGMMDGGTEGCMGMMQGTHGSGIQRPNEQWR
jgi:hypothetical protein